MTMQNIFDFSPFTAQFGKMTELDANDQKGIQMDEIILKENRRGQ
jgi:hypothetical protein